MSIEKAEEGYQRTVAQRAEKVVSESSLEKAKYNFDRRRMTFEMNRPNLKMHEQALELSELKWWYTKIEAL